MAGARDDRDALERLFAAASELPDGERGGYLRQACGGDASLEARLRKLLDLDAREGFLDSQVTALLPGDSLSVDIPTLVGRRIGKYQMLRILGAGGMGTVYEVLQEQPCRHVALKVLNCGLISRAALRRFEQEAEFLGRLQHPAIAQIYEAGIFETDSGPQPFFAMELIDGLPLTEYANRQNLGTRDRVQLLRKVCEGVEHAHSKGIIHRDLKPGNILVDNSGQPKILDFGIARATDADAPFTTLRTDLGQLMGTLAYMSPEQMLGPSSEIGYQSDVYALGVICYELLGGRLPHDLKNRTVPEALRMIRDEEPTPLSSINRIFRGDLNVIIAKALDKDMGRRYATAAEFGADLQRYLKDEPVLAHPPTTAYQLRKFARRYKALVVGAVAVFVVLVLGITGMGWQWAIATRQRNRALEAESAAQVRASQITEAAMGIMQLVDDSLTDLPGGTRASAALAQQALDYLTALPLESESEPPSFRSIPYLVAYAHQRVGETNLVSGKTKEALRSYEQALVIRRKLASQAPDFRPYQRSLVVGQWKVAEALLRLGRFAEADRALSEGMRLLEQISTDASDPPAEAGVYMGGGHRRVGELRAVQGDATGAIASFRRALTYVDAGLNHAADVLNLRRGKATALRGYGEALNAAGQPQEAVEALEESLQIVQQLMNESKSARVWDLSNLAMAQLALSKARSATDRPDQALAAAQRAVEIADRLSTDDLDNFDSAYLAARCRVALGDLRLHSGLATTAIPELEVAIGDLESLAKRDGDHALVRRDLAAGRAQLAAAREMNAAHSSRP